jgi:putative transposase
MSSVPLQQALRHQHTAFANFFAGRAKYPRFKNRSSRQSAHYTRSAFRMKDGELRMAKTSGPLAFVWSFDDVDLASLNPTMVVISREPDGRWYVTDRDINAAKNILAAGRAVARENPGDVCGAGVSRQGSSLPQSAMKQKPHAVRRVA